MTMAPSMSNNDLTSHHSKTCFFYHAKKRKKRKLNVKNFLFTTFKN